MKTETGVMIMKNGKAWGITYGEGFFTHYGWVDPESAEIHNPKFCKKPTDVTWNSSHHTKELETGRLVHVRRTTTVEILGEEGDNV